MANPPDVSVLIATYNVEAYVERAIQSALDQTGVTVEVIVVDDCSTDATWAKIAAFTDARVKPLQLPANGGPSIARNAGLTLARGTWIAVLDGDDALLPGRLQRCLARAAAAQADIVADNLWVRREEDGQEFAMFSTRDLTGHAYLSLPFFIADNSKIAGGHSLGYLKPVFARAFLARHGLVYEPDLRIGEDYLLLAAALAEGAVCAVEPTAGYAYTVRQTSISHRLTLADIDRMLAADVLFMARYPLDAVAQDAQRRRTRALCKMQAFTRLVTALKERDMKTILAIESRQPLVALQLWRAVWVRVRRVVRR